MNVPSPDNLEDEIRALIVSALKLEDVEPGSIEVSAPLFDGGLGLDSIDALEIGVALRKRYEIKIESATDEVKSYFQSVETLAKFVRMKRGK